MPVTPAEAIKKINRISDRWGSYFEGSAEKPNDNFIIRFGDTYAVFTVIEIVENKKMAWLVTDCNLQWLKDKKEWKGTQIEWEFSTRDHSTRIDFNVLCY